ncbi:baseplate J/gp47 family protein [Endozoicomonas sp. 4G]|uniref:baseplate assembly protein n=1 Tax=Endozoicomonas sp. 4G TaxID=2872754 RepID=UPI0020785331|nr:baseplate J/gp47 family protein [Endozoicomonas sp. 4G]
MSSYTAIDLSQLPPPNIVEQLSFETIYGLMKDTLNGQKIMTFDGNSREPVVVEAESVTDENGDLYFRVPAVVEKLLYVQLESDPSAKILAVCAYRESLLRQRVNEAALAIMLAYAQGADLDQHGGNYNLQRLVIDPGDPNATPPVEPTYESDTEFRRRILLVFESLSVAGPAGAYIYHTLSADPQVLDAAVGSPVPGEVVVTVQSREGDGTAGPVLLGKVERYLRDGEIRPLTDLVKVNSVEPIEYTVTAELVIYEGPDTQVVLDDAISRITEYTKNQHRIGLDATLSGIYAALHTTGVENVLLTSPTEDVVTTDKQAPYCTAINVTLHSPDNSRLTVHG